MNTQTEPELVRTEDLPDWLATNALAYRQQDKLALGFGHGNQQYKLFHYPGPADDETMGIFCEWHTEDYFDVDTGPHIAIGLRGPVEKDPHRGRGLAIGILASEMPDPADPAKRIDMFTGCPPSPGGPAFFIEDFTINEGTAAIRDWQLSRGQALPLLVGHRVYRIDIHVSKGQVWAGVWMISETPSAMGKIGRDYQFIGQTRCSPEMPACTRDAAAPGPEAALDKAIGNAFIGTGFSDPETLSWIDNIYIAHWKSLPRRPLRKTKPQFPL